MARRLTVLVALCLAPAVAGNIFHRIMQDVEEKHARRLLEANQTSAAPAPKAGTTISAESDPLTALFGSKIQDALDSDPLLQMAERLKSGDNVALLKEMTDNPTLNELFKDAALAHELVNQQSYLKMIPGVKRFGNRRLAEVGPDEVVARTCARRRAQPCPYAHVVWTPPGLKPTPSLRCIVHLALCSVRFLIFSAYPTNGRIHGLCVLPDPRPPYRVWTRWVRCARTWTRWSSLRS